MGKCVFDGDVGRSVVILKNKVISDQLRDWGVPFDVGEGLIGMEAEVLFRVKAPARRQPYRGLLRTRAVRSSPKDQGAG